MPSLLIHNARILTLKSPHTDSADAPRRGADLADLGVIPLGYVRIADGRIAEVAAGKPADVAGSDQVDVIDAGGCVLMPAFVDCHTHACWAGQRLDEFQQKLEGRAYLDILKSGGGIMSTVRAVREAPLEELVALVLRRLYAMAALGTGTVEIKSGYGLDTDTELKMLRAIHTALGHTLQTIVGTFLGAHAIDPDNSRCVDLIIEETLPAVASEFPGITCDAYCEDGAWSLDQTRRLFRAASELACPLRLHVDQFNSLGGIRLALEYSAVSVDHLEAIAPADIKPLAASSTIAVLLPCTGFHLDDRYAPARELVDAGAAIAIASNCNPGSAPCLSIPFTIALAARKLKLKPQEAITAATFNAACVLGLQKQVGSIEVGKRADLQLLDTTDERSLAHEFAGPGPLVVIINGEIIQMRGVQMEEQTDNG
ncbi:MAG TPA: imidazolonepropionase [Phycisphaerales bacterium]|nr:imidazolonepropionase [Phycisphaerales bacterium]